MDVQLRWHPLLVQPLQVSEGVFRSGYPIACNFPFLQNLGLRSILCLCPDSVLPASLEWAREAGVRMEMCDLGENSHPFVSMPLTAMSKAVDFLCGENQLDLRKQEPTLFHRRLLTIRVGHLLTRHHFHSQNEWDSGDLPWYAGLREKQRERWLKLADRYSLHTQFHGMHGPRGQRQILTFIQVPWGHCRIHGRRSVFYVVMAL